MKAFFGLFGTFCSALGKKEKKNTKAIIAPMRFYFACPDLSNIIIWKLFPRKLQYHCNAIIYLYFVLVKLINLYKLLYLNYKSQRTFIFTEKANYYYLMWTKCVLAFSTSFSNV